MDLSWDLKSDQLLSHLTGRSKGNRQREGLSVREGGGLAPPISRGMRKVKSWWICACLLGERGTAGEAAFIIFQGFQFWEVLALRENSKPRVESWEAAHHTIWDLGFCPLVFSQESGVRACLLFSLGRITFNTWEEKKKEDNFSECEQHLM